MVKMGPVAFCVGRLPALQCALSLTGNCCAFREVFPEILRLRRPDADMELEDDVFQVAAGCLVR
jgi:hypothetical protein